jgi:hypothetical protein
MTTKSKLVSEIIRGDYVPADWAASFAELPLQERLEVVRECREWVSSSPKKFSRRGGHAIKMWEANFSLRESPVWIAAAREVASQLDPPDAAAVDGDDERSRLLLVDRLWVQARSRRGFVLDGSPGAWRPSHGTPAGAVDSNARPAPGHHVVSFGAWSQARLMPGTLTRTDKTDRTRLSVRPGKRASRW